MNFKRKINNGVYFIAEMSANHAGSLDNALKIVKAAKESGADCLKIQTYTADTMTIDCDKDHFKIKGGLWNGYNLYNLYQEAYTPWEWHKAIKDECEKYGLDFLSTPFDKTAVNFLEDLGIEFYKIASFELVDIPLIEYVASKGKPIIISCGMGSIEEIQESVDSCKKHGNDQIVLLKCTSEYPAKNEDMNLAVISDMQNRFGVKIGLSDHSMGSVAPVVAASLGACVIEKHFCLSRDIKNPDCEFSMEPHEFRKMVDNVNAAVCVKGKIDYTLTDREKESTVFRRSIFAVKYIKKGEIFTEDNIRVIRPGYGMKPKFYNELITSKADINYMLGEPINEELINTPCFKSERLYFNEINISDTDTIVKWRSDVNVYKYSRNSLPTTYEIHIKWFENYINDNTRFDFIMRLSNSNKPIGYVSLCGIDYKKNKCEISYAVCEANERNKGYARESIQALISYANSKYGITNFIAEVHSDNIASLKLIKSFGFIESNFRKYKLSI